MPVYCQVFYIPLLSQNRLTISAAGDHQSFIDANDQLFTPVTLPKAETLVSPSPLLQESLSMSLRNPSTWSSNYLPVFQPSSSSIYGANGSRTNSVYFQEHHPPPQTNQRSSHAFNHGNSLNSDMYRSVMQD